MDALFAPFIIDLAIKYPTVFFIVASIGALRIVFKPVFQWLYGPSFREFVKATPWNFDDGLPAKLASLRENPWVSKVFFFLDLVASIKLPPKPPTE